jgi:hypothetical protein
VVAVAAVSVLEASVAVSTQAPVTLMVSALKVATPAMATAVVVPPRVHGDVIAIVSVAPVPEVTTLPLTSSTEALKTASTVLAVVTEVGGTVVKTTRVAVPAIKATTVLVAVESVLVVSVAINWQLLPELIATAENVATPPTAWTLVVPASVHAETSEIVSVEYGAVTSTTPLLSLTDTVKVGSTVPALADAGGSMVKTTWVGTVDANVTRVALDAEDK